MKSDEIHAFNRQAWDHAVESGNRWTQPVSSEEIAKARQGRWSVVLTPVKPTPFCWFRGMPRPPVSDNGMSSGETISKNSNEQCLLDGVEILCLAGSGGQQAPILAAAGASVTVFDQSDLQLGQDRLVADRDNLSLRLVQGDMTDLQELENESFDLIFNPCSTCFVSNLVPVWKECHRVLRIGGSLISGFCSPFTYVFDYKERESGKLVVKYSLPHRDIDYPELVEQLKTDGEPLEFSHSYEEQIGDLLRAGFVLADFFEDRWELEDPLNEFMPSFGAMLATKRAN